jgi:hypothetical protein
VLQQRNNDDEHNSSSSSFFHVNYYLHQGDDEGECALIIDIFLNFLGATSTKETTTMNAQAHHFH